jgi:hypothetical protein
MYIESVDEKVGDAPLREMVKSASISLYKSEKLGPTSQQLIKEVGVNPSKDFGGVNGISIDGSLSALEELTT